MLLFTFIQDDWSARKPLCQVMTNETEMLGARLMLAAGLVDFPTSGQDVQEPGPVRVLYVPVLHLVQNSGALTSTMPVTNRLHFCPFTRAPRLLTLHPAVTVHVCVGAEVHVPYPTDTP